MCIRDSAKAVAQPHGLNVELRPVLREIDMGDWEDLPWAELPRIWPEEYAVWRARPWDARPPHGESVLQAGQRMLDGVRGLVRQLSLIHISLMGAIIKAKPAAAKGQYIRSCVVASTMGPGVKVNAAKMMG